jgi:hypothetical protein
LGVDLVINSEIKYQYLKKTKKINDTYREYSAMKGEFLAKKNTNGGTRILINEK